MIDFRLLLLMFLVAGSSRGILLAAEIPPKAPAIDCTIGGNNLTLRWSTVEGQTYQVQRSGNLAQEGWSSISDPMEATGDPMSFGDMMTSTPRMFYRLMVAPEDFNPSSLSPLWELDAQKDFPSLAQGAHVSQWPGKALLSTVQGTAAARPVYQDGSVVFDGLNQYLSFPMWPGGVGTQWTVSLLCKIRPGIQNLHLMFGCDSAAHYALEFQLYNGSLLRSRGGWSILTH